LATDTGILAVESFIKKLTQPGTEDERIERLEPDVLKDFMAITLSSLTQSVQANTGLVYIDVDSFFNIIILSQKGIRNSLYLSNYTKFLFLNSQLQLS